ncbi:hypothetical protein GC105_09710 [Alkalibaculum sp. M08DMB]|uniref:Uncharacterized protein n=1 Tax=Alkalibaculum sporogenes TaxID=2655001 RepID=A0A6A7K9J6_9FIRM|nr:hypothetical protein [Alkalibaculum sporogenes]MPW26066.1 hypothetical protein [Alkalibaculum sporogenes]
MIKKILLFLHIFIGIGALFGGFFAFTDTTGIQFGMPATEVLKDSPFTSFLIPGIFLFVIIGLGNILTYIICKKNYKLQYYISGCMGLILTMWIVIQCYILNSIHVLHISFFTFGFIQIILAIILVLKGEFHGNKPTQHFTD